MKHFDLSDALILLGCVSVAVSAFMTSTISGFFVVGLELIVIGVICAPNGD